MGTPFHSNWSLVSVSMSMFIRSMTILRLLFAAMVVVTVILAMRECNKRAAKNGYLFIVRVSVRRQLVMPAIDEYILQWVRHLLAERDVADAVLWKDLLTDPFGVNCREHARRIDTGSAANRLHCERKKKLSRTLPPGCLAMKSETSYT